VLNPWLGMAAVLALLGGLTAGLRLWQRHASPHPEVVRKLLHVGMGLVTLSFPWVFAEAWPVAALAAASVVVLLALRLTPLGRVLSAVGRTSLGEVYFPVAVAVLFAIYRGSDNTPPDRRLVLYAVPILLLALADAAAALVGVGYGQHRFVTPDGAKTAEGSVAFFACAFFCVHVPLLLGTDVGRAETLLTALLVAWLATMFEAIAWRGLDNLALPLVSYLLLAAYLDMTLRDLVVRLAVTAILMAFLAAYRRETTLLGSALLGAYLVSYLCWAVGGWQWLLAPLALFLAYTKLSPKNAVNTQRIHNVHAVASVASGGLAWLFLAKLAGHDGCLLPFTLAFAGHLAIIGIARLKCDYPKMPDGRLLAVCVAKGWLIVFLPYLVSQGFSRAALVGTALGLVGVGVAALTFYFTQPSLHDCPTDTPRWLRQAGAAFLGSLVGLVPLPGWERTLSWAG
jgi:phytol kinase